MRQRYFNTEGSCNPKEHYMVRLDERLAHIKEMFVDRKKYFVINRGRQYGKTTTLRALEEYLKDDYIVLSLDFQELGTEEFADASTFVCAFAKALIEAFEIGGMVDRRELFDLLTELTGEKDNSLKDLFVQLNGMCRRSPLPIVLMIDEVDSASNHQVFIEFLAQLRAAYLKRDKVPTFHSVILAGVYDIKNLKLKMRPESEHQYNSPWNIAVNFKVEMSFSAGQIASMLEEYEADHHTGMDIRTVADEIYQYTSGYPVLVSSICKYIDEDIAEKEDSEECGKAWSKAGVEEAVKNMLKENPPLFDSMTKQLDTFQELRRMMEDIIYRGRRIPFSSQEKYIHLGTMFGFLKEVNGQVAVANRIFEMCLLNLFIAEERRSDIYSRGDGDSSQFIRGGRLDMELVLKKFAQHFHDIYGDNDEKFVEDYGRKFFLLYLKPIINGVGNFYLEAQTRDARRTDVIVDYAGEQFIVELKIWRGNEYNERGEAQLTDYLEYYHKDKGYMLSFNFNKKKDVGVKTIKTGGKTIIEAVV